MHQMNQQGANPVEAVNILLVDDRPANLLALEAILDSLGQNLVQAQSGEQALQQLLDQDFAVILLDIRMPGLDGFEVASLVRERDRSRHTPIIFLTEFYQNDEYLFRGYSLGAVDYLIKPAVPEILRAKVRVFVDLFQKNQALHSQLQEIQQLYADLDRQRLDEQEQQAQFAREQKARAQAEETQWRWAFLAEASRVLASSLEYDTTLSNISHLLVPTLADYAVTYFRLEPGQVQQVAVVHRDPQLEPLLDEIEQGYPVDLTAETPLARVLRTGLPERVPEITEAVLRTFAQDDAHLALLRQLTPQSMLIAPLVTHNQIIGAINLVVSTSERVYEREDLTLFTELASRVAFAIDNARLHTELEQSLKDRDDFLTVAAHELKTPITSLRGFAQTLQRQFTKGTPPDPQRIYRTLETITIQAEKLGRLVSQLLDLSRIQAGQLLLERKVTDIGALLTSVAADAQATTDMHRIQLHISAPLWACVDPLRLEQVILNLLNNAIKYSPQGGLIEVQASLLRETTLLLTVTDQGLGIPVDKRDGIFERFYQAHAHLHSSGLGVSLFICRQIVELHAGTIEVQFPASGGTQFLIHLPTGWDNGAVVCPEDVR